MQRGLADRGALGVLCVAINLSLILFTATRAHDFDIGAALEGNPAEGCESGDVLAAEGSDVLLI